MEEIFEVGLHEFLTDVIRRTGVFGKQISDDFQLAA